MSNDDDDRNDDGGNVWASYSDLFTSMAIIFLVMFVFALIKAGVSSLQTVQERKKTRELLDGEVSDKDKLVAQKKLEKIDKSFTKIEEHKNIVKKKIQELTQISKDLEVNKTLVESIVKESKDKTAILSRVNKSLKEKKAIISQFKDEQAQLKKDLAISQKSLEASHLKEEKFLKNIETYKQKLEKSHEDLQRKVAQISTFSKTVKSEKQLKQELLKELKSRDKLATSLKTKISEYKTHLEKLSETQTHQKSKIKDLSKQLASSQKEVSGLEKSSQADQQSLQNVIADYLGQIKGLKGQNSKLSQKVAGLSDGVKNGKGKINELNKQLAGLESALHGANGQKGDLEGKVENLLGKIAGLQKGLKSKGHEAGDLQSKIKGLNGELGKLKGEHENLLSQREQLSQSFKDTDKKLKNCWREESLARKSAKDLSQKIVGAKKQLRGKIAAGLAERLKAVNAPVRVDQETGNVVFEIDNSFLFQRNSSILSEYAKDKLKMIIPIYADVLFNNENIAGKILSFNIEGHASPRYKGEYVDPFNEANEDAYTHNLQLSSRRAESITHFIYSTSMDEFKYSLRLRSLTKSIGRSYSAPILKEVVIGPSRSLASVGTNNCGDYDCSLSRRVEFSFALKDDFNDISKLLETSSK
jgi:chromosome segregation ATPase